MFRPPPVRPNLHDSSSSEDEEDQLLREEREQERLLSEQHGEASEDPASGTSRKRQSDAEIADALNSNDASVKKKKPRLKLTEEKLTGADGLIRVRHEFTSKARYRQPNPINMKNVKDKKAAKRKQFERDVKASAQYVSKLMNCYREFAMDIAPNMHYNDTFLRIQELGKKKMVREYLESMRLEICREQLEKQHGRDKAEKYMHELDHGLTLNRDEYGDDMMFEDVGGIGTRRSTNLTEGSSNEEPSSPNDGTRAPPQVENTRASSATDSQGNHESPDNHEEENEPSFDDVTPPDTQPNFSQYSNPTNEREGGNENIVEESEKTNPNKNFESERSSELAEMELEEPHTGEENATASSELIQKTDDNIEEEDLEEPHASDIDDSFTETNTDGGRDESSDEISGTRKDDGIVGFSDDGNGDTTSKSRVESDKANVDTNGNDKEGICNIRDGEDGESSTDPSTKESVSCNRAEDDSESNGTKSDGVNIQELETQPQYNSDKSTQGSNKLVIIPQTQEMMASDHSQDQSWQLTQDSIVFDGTQRSLLSQGSEGGTQDTLVFDSSQAVEAFVDHSQDY